MCFCLLRTTSCGDRVCPSRSLRFCACKAWIEEAEDRAEVNALIIVRAPVVLKRVLGDFHSCSSLASARHVKACASSCHETSHKVQVPTIPGGLYIYILLGTPKHQTCVGVRVWSFHPLNPSVGMRSSSNGFHVHLGVCSLLQGGRCLGGLPISIHTHVHRPNPDPTTSKVPS